jgi:CheY-like chemotaxis protein
MRISVVILEDNDDRIRVMTDILADKFPFYDRKFFRTAPAAVKWLETNLSAAVCISLDHDLEPAVGEQADPGTGREVADFLAQRQPQCPIVVHTTNVPAAVGMEMALTDAGWSVARVLPYGDTAWIAEAWLPAIRDAIVHSSALLHSASGES